MSSVDKSKSAATRWTRFQDLGREFKDAGREVWLAGLGAWGAVDERSRVLFSDLVERGQRFEDEERPVLEERFRKVGDQLESLLHKVEDGFTKPLAGTLQRFGVPDRDEVQQLIARIEQLTREVEGLGVKAGS